MIMLALRHQARRSCRASHIVFLAVNNNCTLAHSMPVEQEPPTSSAFGIEQPSTGAETTAGESSRGLKTGCWCWRIVGQSGR